MHISNTQTSFCRGFTHVILGTKGNGTGVMVFLSYGPPWGTTSVGTRTDYSVGPWDYPTCAARYLMA
jgi:hypothetical protein